MNNKYVAYIGFIAIMVLSFGTGVMYMLSLLVKQTLVQYIYSL